MGDKNSEGVIFKAFFFSNRNFLSVLVLLCSCVIFPIYGATITYSEDTTDFPNPERGFGDGTVFKEYINLETQGDLPQSLLDQVEKIFTDTRNKKKKIVPRFRYSMASDAALNIMLKHIEQLKPVLQRNYDVIAFLEAGFIGRNGEWWSSKNITTPDARRQVLFKILDVLPKERMVALRYNYYKREIYDSNDPITLSEAFNGSNKSRTGAHNDCFVTNSIDAGTYHVPPWEYNALGIEAEKSYLSADNLYVPQGGETCEVGGLSYATCARALVDLERMRWDMIQSVWYGPVLSQWKTQGCWDEISRRLGYRIVLIDGTFDDEVADGNLDATLHLKNVGFGKIYNPRKLELVLRNTAAGNEYTLPINHDPRFWGPGRQQTVPIVLPIPSTIPFGTYALYLRLPDPAPNLYGIPEYSIHLANTGVWDPVKGYNSLNHIVKVSSHNDLPISVKNDILSEKRSGIRVCEGNPGKRSVSIIANLVRPARVRIDIINLSGGLVNAIVDQELGTGEHHFIWNRLDRAGRIQPAGVYFVIIRSERLLETRQIILRK